MHQDKREAALDEGARHTPRSRTVGRVALLLAVVGLALVGAGRADFDDHFTGATLRLDLFHAGTATMEQISLDRVRIEGPWPGSRTRLIDTSNLGKYFFEVVDGATHEVLYSRGFASIYGEWETTGEARDETVKTLAEALRFPEPKHPVQVRLRKRSDDQSFREIWSVVVDPASRFVQRPPSAEAAVFSTLESGTPSTKVDLLFLGDGYSAEEMGKYRSDVERMTGHLFEIEPFASRKGDFNVWGVETPAEFSGISRPRSGIFRDTPLGASYNSFDSERYVLSLDDRAWRDAAAAAPYDFVVILVNSEKYGGGGIYNLYATAAVDSGFADYLMVHEFGHHFAGLGDEYYTSDVSYEDFHGERVEPWEPNITALHDPERLKWGHLVTTETPLPTPWKKEEFEEYSRSVQAERRRLRAEGAAEADLEELFEKERAEMTSRLGAEEHAGGIGAFEGASYQPRGLYRPAVDCIMFTRDRVGFCAVCSEAIERVIDMYSR